MHRPLGVVLIREGHRLWADHWGSNPGFSLANSATRDSSLPVLHTALLTSKTGTNTKQAVTTFHEPRLDHFERRLGCS